MPPRPPPLLGIRSARPLAAAYLLALLTSTSPRLLPTLLLWSRGKLTSRAASRQLLRTLRAQLSPHGFPTFCATLVGGATLLPLALQSVLPKCRRGSAQLLAKFVAAFVSAWAAFTLLNRRPQSCNSPTTTLSHLHVIQPGPFDQPPDLDSGELHGLATSHVTTSSSRKDLAGKTMDITLFAAVRACHVIITGLWGHVPPTNAKNLASRTAPVALFCFSAATIMHAWFYSPRRLPDTYNRWISAAAELDTRLLLALRHARYGTWVYGQDTGMAPLLGSMCHDYGLPDHLGDPAQTIPIPCQLVHMGCGENCEIHALTRFWKGWLFAARMYAPLQLIVLLRHVKRGRRAHRLPGRTRSIIGRSMIDTARSSAFLATFIALFYYGVCLSRTRIGPRLFSSRTITPQMWDSGLCVLGGCLLCGMSILVEHSSKRLEMILFVLPRAAATWCPRRYLPEYQWREHLAFALSAAVVLTAAQEDPKSVRGVLGNFLNTIMG